MYTVSVIVPTHNRARYAVKTVCSLLQASPDIEVVVSDTSDDDQLQVGLAAYASDPRVRIVRPGQNISVVDNFNAALLAASGEYLAFIGDDDFVSSDIVDVASWASRNRVDAIKFSFPALYFWPDFMHKSRGGFYGGTLRVMPYSGKVTLHDPVRALDEALKNFGAGVLEMPRAYAGMISRELADRIRLKYGALFGGVSPDIYSAALISLESVRCVKIDYPVIIPGASGASTAGQSANGGHVGKLRDNPHIGAFKDLVWDPCIPEFYSVPTVWSFSLLKAIERAGIHRSRVRFSRLFVKCFLFQRAYKNYTFAAMSEYLRNNSIISIMPKILADFIREIFWIFGKVREKLLERFDGLSVEVIDGLGATDEAMVSLGNFTKMHGIKLNLKDID